VRAPTITLLTPGFASSHPSATADVHLVQMWVLPDTNGIEPSYEQRDLGDALTDDALVPVASGRPGANGAISLHQRDATLWVGRLRAGARVTVPDASHVHVFVAAGSASLDGTGALATGDAARLTAAGAPVLEAGSQGGEVLIWETA